MKNSKTLDRNAKRLLKRKLLKIASIGYGIFETAIVFFSLAAVNAIAMQDDPSPLLFIIFLILSFSRGFMGALSLVEPKRNMLVVWKYFSFCGVYLIMAFLFVIFQSNTYVVTGCTMAFFATATANRICLIIEKKKLSSTIFNAILATFGFFAIVLVFLAKDDAKEMDLVVLSLSIVIITLLEVLDFAFERIQLRGLLKIIRETHVFEVLYGLMVLIVSFSFYFAIMEDDIKTIWDGLWYSFAVVTTIGFGDMTAKGPVGRIMTVILGLYGIIVVAVFTSVIVNFYQQTEQERREKKQKLIDMGVEVDAYDDLDEALLIAEEMEAEKAKEGSPEKAEAEKEIEKAEETIEKAEEKESIK